MTNYNKSFALASLASLAAIPTTNAFGLMVPNLVSHPGGLSARLLQGPSASTKIYMEPTSRGRRGGGPGRRGRNYNGGGSFPFGSSPFFPSIEDIMSLYPDMLGVSIPSNAAACSPVGGRRGRGGSYYGYGGPCAPGTKQENLRTSSSPGVRYSSDRLGRGGYPRYEIIEEEDAFKLNMDVPGVKEQDIDIAIEGSDETTRRFLMVRGVRKVEEIRGITTERRFERSFVLDKNLDESRITATMENGVLTVTAPKLIPAPKNKTIKVAINTTSKKNVDETTSSNPVTSATKNKEDEVNEDEDEDGATIDLDDKEEMDYIKAESSITAKDEESTEKNNKDDEKGGDESS